MLRGRLNQSGFNLIELMIAVVIGMFIVLGISQIFISMYSTSQSQDTMAQFQDNERLASTMLMNSIQMAGYYYTSGVPTSTASPLTTYTNSDGSIFTSGNGLVGTGSAVSTASDTINTYFASGGADKDGVINCQGGTAPTGTYTTYINNFSINSSHQLVCALSTNGATANTGLVLASNIQNMTILYGVVTKTGGTTTDTYASAAKVTSNSWWGSVRTVQVTINFCTAGILNPNAKITYPCATTPWIQTINIMGLSQ